MSFTINPTRFALVLSLAVPAWALAQQPHAGYAENAAATAPPRTTSAPAPSKAAKAPEARAGGYKSAFEGYRGFSDAPSVSWRDANDMVGGIGGWRVYAREAQAATPPERAASQPGARPVGEGGHGAHKQQ